MVEYVVIVSFALLALTAEIGGEPSALRRLTYALKAHYDSYAFTVSLSQLPDGDDIDMARAIYVERGGDPADFDKALQNAGSAWGALNSFSVNDIKDQVQQQAPVPVDALKQLTGNLNPF